MALLKRKTVVESSDEDGAEYTNDSADGQDTTAATSVAGGEGFKRKRSTAQNSDGPATSQVADSEDERAAFSRNGKRDSVIKAAARRSVQTLELSSDDELSLINPVASPVHIASAVETHQQHVRIVVTKTTKTTIATTVPPANRKGKGKMMVLSTDEEKEAASENEQESGADDMDLDGKEQVIALANHLLSTKTVIGSSTSSSRIDPAGKVVAKNLVAALIKEKKKQASTVKGRTAGKGASAKGKGKALARTVHGDTSGSDFSPSKSDDEVDQLVSSSSDEEVIAPKRGSSSKQLRIESSSEGDAASDADSDEDEEDKEDSRVSGKKRTGPKPRKGAVLDAATVKAMKKLTRYEKTEVQLKANHPELVTCWEVVGASAVWAAQRADQPPSLTMKLLPFQLEGLDWMVKQEKGIWKGGLLADEMGMGKTVQTIALILSDWSKIERKTTLVLAPTVALLQWKNEIDKFTTGIKVLVFHGASRIDNTRDMAKYDVVLTSYGIMESSFRREVKGFMKKGVLHKEDSILHKLKFHRVVLDESHNIKDRQSNQAKAAFALQSKFKWCLSGTPLQNRVGELYSLIRFLGVDPFAFYYCKRCDCKSLHWLSVKGPCSECHHSGMQHVCYWNAEILKPIQFGGATSGQGQIAFTKLQTLLSRMMLRRTKVERADDLGLPPRVIRVRRDYFTEEEEEVYKSLYQDVARKFTTYASEGTLLNNYTNLFTLITRMRQAADHVLLCLKSTTAAPVQHAPADVPQNILTCRICLDEAEEAIVSACKHTFCRECVRQYIETAMEQHPSCPTCRAHLTIDLAQDAIEVDNENAPRQGFLARINPATYRSSTKIEALVEELSKLRTQDSTIKSLVFSQFTSMLDLVERRLQLGGFKTVRLQGSMTPAKRDKIIQHFTNTPSVTVFLISLKAGGVALNLTEASAVFLLDPWWNPAVELQAMDRIHRLGQHRPVVVTRLIIENSIESRILELQQKKESMTASTLGDDASAMGRLTPEDLQFLFNL